MCVSDVVCVYVDRVGRVCRDKVLCVFVWRVHGGAVCSGNANEWRNRELVLDLLSYFKVGKVDDEG